MTKDYDIKITAGGVIPVIPNNKLVRKMVEMEVLLELEEIMGDKRFYHDGTKIVGLWAIDDRENEDETIWIDCKEEYLDCIVTALNDREVTKE